MNNDVAIEVFRLPGDASTVGDWVIRVSSPGKNPTLYGFEHGKVKTYPSYELAEAEASRLRAERDAS